MTELIIHGFDRDSNGKPLRQPGSWSYSRYALYNECPAKFAFKHIVKLDTGPLPEAMLRGNKIHNMADKYVTGEIDEMPEELQKFDTMFKWAREDGKFFTEQQWGFTNKWDVTGYMVWNGDKKTFMRAVVDLGRYYDDEQHLLIIDHKTGKLYETNEDQVELFALAGLCRFPAVQTAETRLWYLDSADEVVRTFEAKDKKYLIQKWDEAIQPMFKDKLFAPRKNKWCGRCEFSKYAGGPCPVA